MRNFGIMSGRQRLGGASTSPTASSANTHADLYKLPSGSIRSVDPLPSRAEREERAVVIALSLMFFVPLICAGIILRFH